LPADIDGGGTSIPEVEGRQLVWGLAWSCHTFSELQPTWKAGGPRLLRLSGN